MVNTFSIKKYKSSKKTKGGLWDKQSSEIVT